MDAPENTTADEPEASPRSAETPPSSNSKSGNSALITPRSSPQTGPLEIEGIEREIGADQPPRPKKKRLTKKQQNDFTVSTWTDKERFLINHFVLPKPPSVPKDFPQGPKFYDRSHPPGNNKNSLAPGNNGDLAPAAMDNLAPAPLPLYPGNALYNNPLLPNNNNNHHHQQQLSLGSTQEQYAQMPLAQQHEELALLESDEARLQREVDEILAREQLVPPKMFVSLPEVQKRPLTTDEWCFKGEVRKKRRLEDVREKAYAGSGRGEAEGSGGGGRAGSSARGGGAGSHAGRAGGARNGRRGGMSSSAGQTAVRSTTSGRAATGSSSTQPQAQPQQARQTAPTIPSGNTTRVPPTVKVVTNPQVSAASTRTTGPIATVTLLAARKAAAAGATVGNNTVQSSQGSTSTMNNTYTEPGNKRTTATTATQGPSGGQAGWKHGLPPRYNPYAHLAAQSAGKKAAHNNPQPEARSNDVATNPQHQLAESESENNSSGAGENSEKERTKDASKLNNAEPGSEQTTSTSTTAPPTSGTSSTTQRPLAGQERSGWQHGLPPRYNPYAHLTSTSQSTSNNAAHDKLQPEASTKSTAPNPQPQPESYNTAPQAERHNNTSAGGAGENNDGKDNKKEQPKNEEQPRKKRKPKGNALMALLAMEEAERAERAEKEEASELERNLNSSGSGSGDVIMAEDGYNQNQNSASASEGNNTSTGEHLSQD
ncbi:hypothetical protein B0T20DRAFT_478813 [Sordaria brevicollis]|uniref:Uncharacterized protein n=1 Tax=Sordaria brevicollis TaxID=83679 RepID=A0AAE0PH83_SORBR|nr:hypothetical protein B0T20DRAFT_478813 [Sordaria brevicollis]